MAVELFLNDTATECRITEVDIQTMVIDTFGKNNVSSKALRQEFNALHNRTANEFNKQFEKGDARRVNGYQVWQASCGAIDRKDIALSSFDLNQLARKVIKAKTGEMPRYVSPSEAC